MRVKLTWWTTTRLGGRGRAYERTFETTDQACRFAVNLGRAVTLQIDEVRG